MMDLPERQKRLGALGDEQLAREIIETDSRVRSRSPEQDAAHRGEVTPAAYFWAQAQHLGETGVIYDDADQLYDAISRRLKGDESDKP